MLTSTISAWIDILGVGGTWYRKHRQQRPQWLDAGHPLSLFLSSRGFRFLRGRDNRQYDWKGNLVGWKFWRRLLTFGLWKADISDWREEGIDLWNIVDPPFDDRASIPGKNLHVWGHSHGGNVVLHALAEGMKANVVVLVCTPVRADMLDVLRRARQHVGCLIMIFSDGSDLMQLLGKLGDGAVDLDRTFDHLGPCQPGLHTHFVDQYVFVDDGHSNILNDASRYERLEPILRIIEARHGRPDYLTRPTTAELAAAGFAVRENDHGDRHGHRPQTHGDHS